MTAGDPHINDAVLCLRDGRQHLLKISERRLSPETVAIAAQATATQAVAFALLAINETLKQGRYR